MEDSNAKDTRQRVFLLLHVDVPLLQFTGAITKCRRKLSALAISLPPDLFAVYVCAELAAPLFYIRPVHISILDVYPDADLAAVPVEGRSYSETFEAMSATRYRTSFLDDNVYLRARLPFAVPDVLYPTIMQWMESMYPAVALRTVTKVVSASNFYPPVAAAMLHMLQMDGGVGGVGSVRRGRKYMEECTVPPSCPEYKDGVQDAIRMVESARVVSLTTTDCIICMDTVPDSDMRTCSLDAAHTACSRCLYKYVHGPLYSEHKAVRKCAAECEGAYTDEDLKFIMGLHFIKFVQLEAASILSGTFIACPCGNMMHADAGLSKTALCSMCGLCLCIDCQKPWRRCACGVEQDPRVREKEEAMTAAVVRQCACGKRFVKHDGCNKMTCPCGKKMCYICEIPISSYDHFCKCMHKETCDRCHLYTDADAKDAAALDRIQDAYRARP